MMNWIGSFFLFAFVSTSAWASPPVDLTDLSKGPGGKKIVRPKLTDKDLIFTDNLSQYDPALRTTAIFKDDSFGRARPSMQSKPILRFRKDFRVRVLRHSRDGKWIAVELLNGARRAWVQKPSLSLPKSVPDKDPLAEEED